VARSRITATRADLINDSGSVLWSFVLGEQLEYPVNLEFIENDPSAYEYEAVVVEGDNILFQTSPPTRDKDGGVQVTLNTRLPIMRGNWDAPQAYNTSDVVYYNLQYYEKRYTGSEAVIDSDTPDISDEWRLTTGARIYLQFSKELGTTWASLPEVGSPTYGFFELRVTEGFGVYPRTWKPVRGMVELLFSPTHEVPDV